MDRSDWILTAMLVMSLALCPLASPVVAQACEGFPDANADRVEAFLRTHFAAGNAGMVIGIVDERGSRVFSAGTLDNGMDQAMNGDTVFEIGSVTKTFTVLLLLDMAKRGEMKLDDPVANYLPPEVKMPSHGGKEITLLNLAAQDSGLPFNPDNLSSKPFPENYNEYTARDLYSFLGAFNLKADPGSGAVYSNVGMTLLGHVMERKAGTDYESLVIDRICLPLKMKDTRISLTPELKSRLAIGHDKDGKPAPPYKLQVIAPAGALLSTANDLLKYLSANLGFNETELNPFLREMHVIRHTRGVIGTQEMGRTAMPWCDEGVYHPPGANLLGHAGGCPGYSSFIGFDLKGRRGVVVLSNQRKLRPASTGWQILQGMPLTSDNMLVREVVGIGTALESDEKTGMVRISRVFRKSSAAEAGLSAGLIIQKLNGQSVLNKTPGECFQMMNGPIGTKVQLEVVDSKGNKTTVEVTKRRFLTLT